MIPMAVRSPRTQKVIKDEPNAMSLAARADTRPSAGSGSGAVSVAPETENPYLLIVAIGSSVLPKPLPTRKSPTTEAKPLVTVITMGWISMKKRLDEVYQM